MFLIPALAAFASILNRTEWRDSIGWNSALLFVTILIAVKWPIIFSNDLAARILGMLPILGPLALFAMFTALPVVLWWHGTSLDQRPEKGTGPRDTPKVCEAQVVARSSPAR